VRRQSAPWPLPPIAFPLEGGSACLFAGKHLLDVGSLSGRARASRIRLITSRHSLLPASCPAPPWAFLAVGLPRTEGGRAGTTLASEEGREDRARLGPERSRPARAELGAGEERSGSTLGQAEVRGFPRSAPEVHAGVGACYRPGATSTARGCRSRPLPGTVTFWSKPLSLFGLFSHDDRFADSLTFTLPAF